MFRINTYDFQLLFPFFILFLFQLPFLLMIDELNEEILGKNKKKHQLNEIIKEINTISVYDKRQNFLAKNVINFLVIGIFVRHQFGKNFQRGRFAFKGRRARFNICVFCRTFGCTIMKISSCSILFRIQNRYLLLKNQNCNVSFFSHLQSGGTFE